MSSNTLLAGDDVNNYEDYEEESSFSIAKALTYFFGLALICGVVFGIAYTMGKSAGLSQASAALPAASNTVLAATNGKPDAAQPEVKEAEAPIVSEAAPVNTSAAPAQQQAAEPEKSAIDPAPLPVKAPVSKKMSPKPEAVTSKMTGGIAVQVAAVRHEEDAQALVAALQRKSYPVFLTNGANDPLFHVQVGPFNDVKDAESIKARLVADGYNAIVKK